MYQGSQLVLLGNACIDSYQLIRVCSCEEELAAPRRQPSVSALVRAGRCPADVLVVLGAENALLPGLLPYVLAAKFRLIFERQRKEFYGALWFYVVGLQKMIWWIVGFFKSLKNMKAFN